MYADNTEMIVAKKLEKKEYPFYEEDGIIYHINYNKDHVKKL